MNLRLRQALVRWPVLFFLGTAVHFQGQAVARGGDLSLLKDAAQAIAAGNLERAENELQSVLQTSPEEFRALNLLGIVRAQQRREPEAERLFRRALEIKPDFTSAHTSLGMLYVQMSKPDQAIPELKRLCASIPVEPMPPMLCPKFGASRLIRLSRAEIRKRGYPFCSGRGKSIPTIRMCSSISAWLP